MSDEAREKALKIGIGRKVRDLRKKRGMTLARVGELSGLSVGLLSQVENDVVVPPIPTLLNIARALEVGIDTFFVNSEDQPRISVVKKGERAPENNRRPADVGYHYSALAHRRTDKSMEPFLVEFEPRSREEMKFFEHRGEEFIYVLDGIVEFRADGDNHILEAGDSIYFDADQPHAVRGVDPVPSKVLIVITG